MIILYICIFFLGASVASFLNATAYRIDNKYKYPDIITKGSKCEKCKHTLAWWELFPIVGYIYIKGKCTSCGKGINVYYPLSELLLGTIFLLFYGYLVSWQLWIVVILLFVLCYHDIKYKAIPKNVVHVFLLLCTLFFLLFYFDIKNIYLSVIITLLLMAMNFVKKSFGMGDILILLGLGILLTYEKYLIMFWLGLVIAILYSLVWILINKINIKKAKVPMIPFFTISFCVSVLFGSEIYIWLLNLMGIW